ncbi:methyltransferase, partial [bacterium]|nr:methyltransferase [bacterium]
LLFGVEVWREFFFQNIRRLTELAHGYGLKVMMHSCGSIRPLIPHLIEAGVDILDPIQVSAEGMGTEDLKREFGHEIVFHGGIDTQHVLPRGSVEEVESHVKETMGTLGDSGGYVFAPSQILGPDIPVENVLSMYETAKNLKF